MTVTVDSPSPTSARASRRASWAWALLVGAIIAAGAVVRLVGLGSDGLWVDEISVVVSSTADSVLSSVRHRLGPLDPPLHFLAVNAALRLPVSLETAARLPSAICGVVEVGAIYLVGRRLFGRRAEPLVAAALLAVAPFAVRYSQEARYYTPFSALHLLTWWALLTALDRGHRWWWAYGALSGAALLTSPFAALTLATQVLVIAVWAWRDARRKAPVDARRERWRAVVAVTVAAAMVLPWAVYEAALWAFGPGGTYRLGNEAVIAPLGSGLARELLAWLLGNEAGLIALSALLALLAASAPILAVGRARRAAVACLVLAVGTVLVVAIVSDVVGTYLAVRRVEFVLPLLLLAAAAGLLGLWERLAAVATGWVAGGVAGAAAAVLLVASVFATAHEASLEKSGWREAAVRLQAAAPGTTVVLGPFSASWYPEVVAYLRWLGVDRTLVGIHDLDVGTWRPGAAVLWLTAEPVSAPGLSTEALNRVDRLEIIAGDDNWGMVKLPVYLSRSRPSSEAEFLAQRDLVARLGWVLRTG